MTKVYLHTFGCKANQYDTEVVRQALRTVGAVTVEDPREADAAVSWLDLPAALVEDLE